MPGDRRRVRLLGHACSGTIARSAPRRRPQDQHDGSRGRSSRELAHDRPSTNASDPNAIARKTRLSSGADTTFVLTTRTASGTRPRNRRRARCRPSPRRRRRRGCRRRSATLPERDVEGWLGDGAVHVVQLAIQTARTAEPTNPMAIMICAFLQPSRRWARCGGRSRSARARDRSGTSRRARPVRERQLHDLVRAHLSGYYDPDVQARQDRELPIHLRTASTSISTSQRGSARSQTIPVQAGRALPNTSPCTGST